VPRPYGAFDESPIVLVGWPSEVADQILRDQIHAEIAQEDDVQEDYVPIRLSAVIADRRPLKVAFGDDTLSLTYKPSSVNAVQEARELDEREKGQHLMAQARSLAEIIASWDLQDDDGKPLPVSADVIAPLGLDFTSKVTRAILDDLLPNRTTASDSRNGSQAASSAPAPSGT
jgi:hypothetical protein